MRWDKRFPAANRGVTAADREAGDGCVSAVDLTPGNDKLNKHCLGGRIRTCPGATSSVTGPDGVRRCVCRLRHTH
jgi:hypothetical protein